jgi:uncharacterized protein (TIGR03067 family)
VYGRIGYPQQYTLQVINSHNKTSIRMSRILPWSENNMKIAFCLLLAVVSTVGAGDAKDAKKELAKFDGVWNVTEVTYNGKDHSKLKFNFVFKGDEVVVEGDDKVKVEYARLKIKVDSTTTPKIFDLTVGAGVQKGADMEGIYELKGDELRICVKVFGKDRPGEFSSPDGSSTALLVLKRPAK